MTLRNVFPLTSLMFALAWAVPGQATANPTSPLPCQVTDIQANANMCAGYVSGNDSIATAIDAATDSFSWTVNTLYQYKDDNIGTGSTTFLFDAVGNDDKGTLTFNQALSGPFILSVKGGPNVAYYFF